MHSGRLTQRWKRTWALSETTDAVPGGVAHRGSPIFRMHQRCPAARGFAPPIVLLLALVLSASLVEAKPSQTAIRQVQTLVEEVEMLKGEVTRLQTELSTQSPATFEEKRKIAELEAQQAEALRRKAEAEAAMARDSL